MIDLLIRQSPNNHLLRLVKRDTEDLWDICLGNWLGKESPTAADLLDFKSTEPMTINANGLHRLAQEIRRILHEKPGKEYPFEEELDLFLKDNVPQFKVKMAYVHPESPYYEESRKEKFQFSPGFNITYSTIKHGQVGDEYLYEDGGRHQAINMYYTESELNDFADDIDKEAGEVLDSQKN